MTTPPRTEGAGLLSDIAYIIGRARMRPTWGSPGVAGVILAAVRAHDAAHSAPQPVPVVATGAGWVACSERMPEDGVDVLVVTANQPQQVNPRQMYVNDDGVWEDEWGHLFDGTDDVSTVTHWMPLPPAPGAPAAQATVPGGEHSVIIESMRAIAREHGWALAVHGSLIRDIDLIAVPWVEGAAPWTTVYDAWIAKLPLKDLLGSRREYPPGRDHFRRCELILHADTVRVEDGNPKGTWDPPALDVSFMPRAADVIAELTRLGWVHGGAGGARLSDGAWETILRLLKKESDNAMADYEDGEAHDGPDYMLAHRDFCAAEAAIAEIEALPRVRT